jgi:hypothetical protein
MLHIRILPVKKREALQLECMSAVTDTNFALGHHSGTNRISCYLVTGRSFRGTQLERDT